MRAQRSGGIAGPSRRRSRSRHVGFLEDMNSIGTRLKQAQSAYDHAHGKLSTGRGNLVGQAQKLRQLGVKPSKSLAPALVDGAYESDELPFVLEEDLLQVPPKLGNGLAPEHAR
jgi:DNA anti-recombination protein RmuC